MTRGKKHCFQVSHKKNMQQRIFLLHAKGDDDMKHWMRVINAAIDSTRPPGEVDAASPSSPLSAAKASPRQLGASSSSSMTPSDDEEEYEDHGEEGQEALGNSGFLFPVCTFSDYDTNYDWSSGVDIVGSNGADVGLPVCTFSGLTDDCKLIPLKIYYKRAKKWSFVGGRRRGASNAIFVSDDCCALDPRSFAM